MDYLPWNWFGGDSRLGQSQELPPPTLDETEPSVLRSDGFSTSTPAATDRRETGSNLDSNPATNSGPPPTSEPGQSTQAGHHNLRPRANNPNVEDIQNTDQNDSEYSTEPDQGDPGGPRITVTSARSHLKRVKHVCHEEFKRLSQVDFSRETDLDMMISTQRRYHQLMTDYQIAADQLHRLLKGRQLSDQKRTYKLSYANYLNVAKQLGARIKQLQRTTSASGQRTSNQEEETRNVHFQVPNQTPSAPSNFSMPQPNVGHSQHQPPPVQRQPSVPQPGAQTQLTGLNPNEERVLRELMSKAGLGMPGQRHGAMQGLSQNPGYGQGYLSYPQASSVQTGYQPTQGYGQGFLPYHQAPIAQPHYQPPSQGYGFNRLPVNQQQMSTTNSFQDVSLSEAGQLRYDGRGMPKFEIESFKGDRLDYPRFKNTFMSIIGNRQIYAEEKALRLVNLLDGEPRKLIAGVLEGNIGQHTHGMIWDILDKFYGGQKRQMTNHIQKIANFTPIKNTTVEELKRFYILLTEIKSFFLTHNPTVLQHEFSTELGLVKQLVQERHLNLYMDWYQNLHLLDNLDTFVNWIGHLLTVRQHAHEEASKPRSVQVSAPRRFGKTTLKIEEVVEDEEDFQDCKEEIESEEETDVVAFVRGSSSKQSDLRQNKKSEGSFPPIKKCDFCKLNNHTLVECNNFRKEEYSKRNDWILTNGFCYHCLNKGHTSKQCKLFPNRTCGINGCSRRHHRLLHPPDGSVHYCIDELDLPEESESKTSDNYCVASTSTSAAAVGKRHFVGVRTIPVWACNGERRRLVVAALDSCADNTNISTELAEELKLDVIHGSVTRYINYMDRVVAVKSSLVKFNIEPYYGEGSFPIQAWTVDNLIKSTQVIDWAEVSKSFSHLRDLQIPPLPKKNAKVDILLGCEFAALMASSAAAIGTDKEPIAEKTVLGWACSGPLPGFVVKTKSNSCVQTSCRISSESALLYTGRIADQHKNEDFSNLERLIKSQWEVENLGMSEPIPKLTNKMRKTCSKPTPDEWTEKEKLADQRMEVVYLKDQKAYQASIPWKNGTPQLKSNFGRMMKRQTRMNRPENLLKIGTSTEEFTKIFDDYLSKGYIEEIPESSKDDLDCWWLNYFPVIDRGRETTKCRIVFDARATNEINQSLNSDIDCGPNRLNDLFMMLVGLRKFQFAVSADISEMFLRVKLNPRDRHYHRFWFNGKLYQWCVILFGNTSSPNISQKVLEQNNIDHGQEYPVAVETVQNKIYVDDAIASKPTEEEISVLASQLQELLAHAGMKICKFYTNSKKALLRIPEELRAKQVLFTDDEIIFENNKILGLTWNAETDCLQFVSRFKNLHEWNSRKGLTTVKHWTKRLILKASASIYDPLGLISPFTIIARVLLQRLWMKKSTIGWDTPLPEDIVKDWLDWLQGVFQLQDLKIPRFLKVKTDSANLQLHIFSDASQDVYACACYLRVAQSDGEVDVNLVCAKARVTPVKSETISRLELMGCLIATRIAASTAQALDIKKEDIVYWTDSMTCLHWINTPAKSLQAYVGNRTSQIQACSDVSQWRHCPTKQNPADIPTRKISGNLQGLELWWKGPSFLKKLPEAWPKTPSLKGFEDLQELRQSTFLSTDTLELNLAEYHPRNFSSGQLWDGYRCCLVKIAWCLKFKNSFKRFQTSTNLSENGSHQPRLDREDFEKAEEFLVKQAQQEFYSKELEVLRAKGTLSKANFGGHSEIQKFFPQLDEKGIMRSKSRLSKLDQVPHNARFPIILHRRSELARLLVDCLHQKIQHPIGQNALKAKVHENYAIVGLGTLIKQSKDKCLTCKRQKSLAKNQLMAPLPEFCLAKTLRAFETTGLDFAGPFELKVGRRIARKKVSVLVLTCMTTRAVHFEVTEQQDTSSVLNAVSRFCSVRGVPDIILSDNQTSFRSSSRELEEWVKSLDFNYLQERTNYGYKDSKGIKWIFNPPRSPHFGGIFEIMVKAMKRALYATTSKAALIEDEFRTIIAECANLLNSRPLTKPGDEADELPLTPNHFLHGRCGGTLAPPFESEDPDPITRWKRVQTLISHCWSRFMKEILPLMVPRRKWTDEMPNIKEDDVVLEIDPNLPRGLWRLLRVAAIIPSEDGLVRKVKVVSADHKEYERSISRLCPII